MDERNTGNLVPPAIEHRDRGAQPRDEGGGGSLSTADLASAGTRGGEPASADRVPSIDFDRSAGPQHERVEPAGTERIAAPQMRVEPRDERNSTASPAPAAFSEEARSMGHTPAATSAPPAPRGASAGVDTGGAGEASRPGTTGEATAPLFAAVEAQRFRDRWDEIQTGFVDDPRRAVEQADHMVAEVMTRLADVFADERAKLEGQWSKGDDVSTEDFRVTLRHYRSFFTRLLSV